MAFGPTPYSLTLNPSLAGGVNSFGFWLSALDAGNLVSFSSGGHELFTFNPKDVINAINLTANPSEYYGNPSAGPRHGANPAEPYVYLNFFDPNGSFDKVSFTEVPALDGYESDNHTVGNNILTYGQGTVIPLVFSSGVPEPTT